jgi:hypothetical protein
MFPEPEDIEYLIRKGPKVRFIPEPEERSRDGFRNVVLIINRRWMTSTRKKTVLEQDKPP